MTNYLLWGFSKEIKSIIMMNFYRLIYFLKFSLYEVFHWYFSVSSIGFFQSIKLASYYNYKNHDFVHSWLSTISYLINVEDQLNSKNLQMKLRMRLPKFHPQYFFKLSVLYIPVHILGSYKWNLVVWFLISNVRFFLE